MTFLPFQSFTRIHSQLVEINKRPFYRGKSKMDCICALSGKPIAKGDMIYRPENGYAAPKTIRAVRYLAAEVDALE